MKDSNPKLFMKYIIEETGITFEVGDLLSVLDATFLQHSYDGKYGTMPRHLKYVKISKDLMEILNVLIHSMITNLQRLQNIMKQWIL